MACPYFIPDCRRDDILWPHPSRLPLGAGFGGHCCAPGHEGTEPTGLELKDHCNLGYARCSRLPADRVADAVRYAVAREGESRLVIAFVTERAHAPVALAHAEYDCTTESLSNAPADPAIRKQLECYAAGYLARRRPGAHAAGHGA